MPYPTRYFYSLLLNVCEGPFFFSILSGQDSKVGVPAELPLFSELTTCEKILIFDLVNDRKVEQVGSYTGGKRKVSSECTKYTKKMLSPNKMCSRVQ